MEIIALISIIKILSDLHLYIALLNFFFYNQAYDSDSSDIEQIREKAPKKSALNNLFSGKKDDAGDDENNVADEDEAYLAKLSR